MKRNMTIESKKLELMRQLLLVNDESVLDHVQVMLNSPEPFALSHGQKAELDDQLARMADGEGESLPWAEVKRRLGSLVSAQ